MSGPRFQVATVSGYEKLGSVSGSARESLSATVCDTLYLWREIKTYRSLDRGPWPEHGGYRGREGALSAAADHADYLNGLYDGELA